MFVLIGPSSTGYAWYDKTHIAVAKPAGYRNWYNSAGADKTKVKAGDIEEKNHYFNNNENEKVTDKMVLNQVKLYNSPTDSESHLYGAIVAALRNYQKKKASGRFAEY